MHQGSITLMLLVDKKKKSKNHGWYYQKVKNKWRIILVT